MGGGGRTALRLAIIEPKKTGPRSARAPIAPKPTYKSHTYAV